MKESIYNFLVERDNNLYCFNGLTSSFFKASILQRDNIERILASPEYYKEKLPSFYKTLLDGKFIAEDTVDELEVIRSLYNESVNNKSCKLTILPTLDCNFRCWYCVQNHESKVMSIETIELVKKHIAYVLKNNEIEDLQIDWFGGEPFLCFDKVIEPISIYAKQVCKENNVSFFSTVTTNGYLITEEIASKLEEFEFKIFQITLDGDKEHHDKTRVAKNDSSFDTILRNINTICKYTPKATVLIRINYDDKNLNADNIFTQISSAIEPKYRDKIQLLFRKIWQIGKVVDAEEKIKSLITRFKSAGFSFQVTSDLVLNNRPCYVSQKNMKLITPEGKIGKCTAIDDFESNPLGYLQSDGSVKWVDNLSIPDIYAKPLFENKMCLSCKYLPICMGPCPRDINPRSTETFIPHCKKRSNDLKFTDSILLFCEANQ